MANDGQMKLRDVGRLPPVMREIGLGVGYWLAFLIVLEPDNILRALRAGSGPGWREEVLRIAGASLLGASTSPLLFSLVRRFPVQGKAWWRHAAIQSASCISIAAGLIFISCVLAELFLPSEHRPFLRALRDEFVANWLLLSFCIAGFIAIIHALRFFHQIRDHELAAVLAAGKPGFLTQLPIRTRGQVTLLELDSVDWIEAQGNYLALHAGPVSHLIRESLANLEPRLDPQRFTRIHRRTIVAVDRIRDMKSLGAGDAMLRLKDGTELRLSRNFRDRLRAPMSASPAA